MSRLRGLKKEKEKKKIAKLWIFCFHMGDGCFVSPSPERTRMKRKLATIAKELSEEDIQELIRLKKTGDKRVVALRRKRDKIAAALEKVEAELAGLLPDEAPAKRGAKRGGKKRGAKPGPKPGAKRGAKRNVNFTAAVRDVLVQAGQPLRAAEVVERLPAAGIKVKDVTDMKKRVSVILASQKNSFEQVERGVYQIKAAAAEE
jgi:hypothetical protein